MKHLRNIAAAAVAGATACSAIAAASDYTLFNMVRRLRLSNGDYMSTIASGENPAGSTDDGVIFYVQKNNDPYFYQPLNRLFKGVDHMESLATNEGGYSFEALLGFMSPGQVTATSAVMRWFKGSTGDHLIGRGTESFAGQGYTSETPLGYSYARQGTSCSDPLTLTNGASGSAAISMTSPD